MVFEGLSQPGGKEIKIKIFSSLVTKVIKLTKKKKLLNIPFNHINIQLRTVP